MDTFSEPHFTNDDAARRMIENVRWPDGPTIAARQSGDMQRRRTAAGVAAIPTVARTTP